MISEFAYNGRAIFKVIGVGGVGVSAVNAMTKSRIGGLTFIAADIDVTTLEQSKTDVCIQLGQNAAKEHGTDMLGWNYVERRASATIRDALRGADMVLIVAGLGGGTGTEASLVVAQIAKELGALTVGLVSMPFGTGSQSRMEKAKGGWEKLKEQSDTILTIPAGRILQLSPKSSMFNGCNENETVDDIFIKTVRAIIDPVNTSNWIGVDFSDLQNVIKM